MKILWQHFSRFFILYIISPFSAFISSIHFSSFFFFLVFLLHTLSLSLSPFFYLLCLPHSRTFQASSTSRRSSHSPALSLSLSLSLSFSIIYLFIYFIYFLNLILNFCKNAKSPLFSTQFSSRFGRMRFVGPGEKIFS